jgi:predicted transcriptional regulator
MEKVAKAVLRYLFQEYLKAPNISYTINGITSSYKTDPSAVVEYLEVHKWIREPWVYQNNVVTCRITVEGIEEINPVFIRNKLKSLIGGLIEHGGRKSLMGIFEKNIDEYSIALDIIYQLEKLGLILIIHAAGEINIELTAYGWKFFEKRGKSLFALMTLA